jgi:hypothetical protein
VEAASPSAATGTTAQPVATKNVPATPVPWILAGLAAAVFIALAFLPDKLSDDIAVTPGEYKNFRDFTIFFIGALLPSDAVIRFGRGILFRTIGNAKEVAAEAPRATMPQYIAFVAFLAFAAVTVFSDKLITDSEYRQIYDVVQFLIVALLPSEAVIRVGRALYLRDSPTVSTELAKKI